MNEHQESLDLKDMMGPIEFRIVEIKRIDHDPKENDGVLMGPTFSVIYESQNDPDVFNMSIDLVGERIQKMGLDQHEYFPGWTNEPADQ